MPEATTKLFCNLHQSKLAASSCRRPTAPRQAGAIRFRTALLAVEPHYISSSGFDRHNAWGRRVPTNCSSQPTPTYWAGGPSNLLRHYFRSSTFLCSAAIIVKKRTQEIQNHAGLIPSARLLAKLDVVWLRPTTTRFLWNLSGDFQVVLPELAPNRDRSDTKTARKNNNCRNERKGGRTGFVRT